MKLGHWHNYHDSQLSDIMQTNLPDIFENFGEKIYQIFWFSVFICLPSSTKTMSIYRLTGKSKEKVNSILNVKALIFSMIVKTDGSFAALA